MTLFLKKIFNISFFFLFLLSFFLIEGEYKFYLFAAWAFFLFFFNRLLKKNEASKSVIFAIILSLLFFVNIIFSRQIPLSIEKLFFYLIALGVFIFFSLYSKDNFKPIAFFYYLSIFTSIINVIVLFFTFYNTDQQSFFPGMNLLVKSYGHNHYAAFLLLTTPIFWWQLLFRGRSISFNSENRFLSVLLLISSYLLIILSLARLALIISLFQLIIIFLTNKKLFAIIENDHIIKVIIKTFIFIFLSISSIFLFLSIPLNKQGESICPLIFNKKEICKPLIENDRFKYWQKAWLIFKENPYFGVGLKNFNFASREFPIENYQLTSYAHNIFLHNFAEGGLLIGGFFVFFIIYIFYKSFLIMKKNNKSLYTFLWLAALASFINAMFDFDWNFFVIFTLTLIFLAIILQDDIKVATKINFRYYFIFLIIISIFFVSYDFIVRLLYKNDKINQIVSYFPYSDRQIRLLISDNKLSSENFNYLYPIYRKDAEFLYQFISFGETDLEKKTTLQIEWSKIDPPAFINNVSFEKLNFKSALPLANQYVDIVQKYNFLNNHNFLDYWDQKNMAQHFFNFANEAYLAGNMEYSANYYKNAIILNEFIIEDRKIAFFNEDDYLQVTAFLKYFKEVDPERMGKYFYEYMRFYEKTLIYLFKNHHMEDFFTLSEAMFDKQYNFSWFLWRDLIDASKTIEEKQLLMLVYDHFKDMSTWYDFLPTMENIKNELSR